CERRRGAGGWRGGVARAGRRISGRGARGGLGSARRARGAARKSGPARRARLGGVRGGGGACGVASCAAWPAYGPLRADRGGGPGRAERGGGACGRGGGGAPRGPGVGGGAGCGVRSLRRRSWGQVSEAPAVGSGPAAGAPETWPRSRRLRDLTPPFTAQSSRTS